MGSMVVRRGAQQIQGRSAQVASSGLFPTVDRLAAAARAAARNTARPRTPSSTGGSAQFFSGSLFPVGSAGVDDLSIPDLRNSTDETVLLQLTASLTVSSSYLGVDPADPAYWIDVAATMHVSSVGSDEDTLNVVLGRAAFTQHASLHATALLSGDDTVDVGVDLTAFTTAFTSWSGYVSIYAQQVPT